MKAPQTKKSKTHFVRISKAIMAGVEIEAKKRGMRPREYIEFILWKSLE